MQVTPDKYIDGLPSLRRINDRAIKANFNRQLNIKELVKGISKDKGLADNDTSIWNMKFPVSFAMSHNDTEMRILFSWGEGQAQIDMSFSDYDKLPAISAL